MQGLERVRVKINAVVEQGAIEYFRRAGKVSEKLFYLWKNIDIALRVT